MLTRRPIIVHCIDKGSIDRTLVSLRFNTAMDIVTDVCSKSNRMAQASVILGSNRKGPVTNC